MPRANAACWPLLALALLLAVPNAAGFNYVQTTGAQNLSAATLGYPSSAAARTAAVRATAAARASATADRAVRPARAATLRTAC